MKELLSACTHLSRCLKLDLEKADSGSHWPLGKYRARCVCFFSDLWHVYL